MARLLLFDIDMTLIKGASPGLGPGRFALDLAFERTFGISAASDGVIFDGRTDRGIFRELIEFHRVAEGDGAHAFAALTEAYLLTLAETTPAYPTVVLPGVLDLLEALRPTHTALGLATGNMRRGAELKLAPHGLWEAFATGGFGDHTEERAELVAEGLANLASHLGIDPDPADCLVIGDTPLDIAAAHAVGAKALAVATGRYTVDDLLASGADAAIADFTDTAAALALLVS
jgi:phosphoglycolate phosphatase-like HAD superfamily hydrolase